MLKKTHAVGYRTFFAMGACVLVSAGCDNGPSIVPPYNLRAFPVSDAMVSLSWICDSTDHEGFRIYRDGGSGFEEIMTVPSDWWGYWDDTIVTGTYYTYYVVAYTGADESWSINQVTIEARAPYCDILTLGDGETLTIGDMYDITWHTNDPVFDPEICLSLDNGSTYPHVIQGSWAPNGSPYSWKVGYRNTEPDPTLPPVWGEQVVSVPCTECKIVFDSYEGPAPTTGFSDGTFTIQIP